MEFCPKCGAVMFPSNRRFKCQCGYEMEITDKLKDKYNVSEEVESKDTVIFTGDDVGTLPTTRAECLNVATWRPSGGFSRPEGPMNRDKVLQVHRCKYTWRSMIRGRVLQVHPLQPGS